MEGTEATRSEMTTPQDIAARRARSSSFAEDLAREHVWVQKLARRLVGSGSDADDLAQETLRVAWEKRVRGQGISSGSPAGGRSGAGDRPALRRWLGAVARRAALVGWRSEANRDHREREAAQREALPSTAEAVANAEARRRLVDAVLGLEPSLRDAVLLRYFEGLSYGLVAERLQVSQVAARQRVSRGVAALRERLERESDPQDGGGSLEWLSGLVGLTARNVSGSEKAASTAGVSLAATGTAALIMKGQIQWAVGAVVLLAGGIALLGGWRPSMDLGPNRADSALVDAEELVPVGSQPLERPSVDGARIAAPLVITEPQEREPDVTPTGLAGELFVRVMDGRGRTVPGVTVELTPDMEAGFSDAGFHSFDAGQAIAGLPTATPGLYRADVGPGEAYQVAAHADGYARVQRAGCFEGSTIEIVLLPGARFEGTVRAAADGIPLEGAMVRVFHGSDWDHIDHWTDTEGRFAFEDLVPGEGAYFVSPREHRATRHTETVFESGATLTRDFEVETGWAISGQVRDATTEAPIGGAEVSAWSFQGASAWTDVNGFYELRGLKTLPGKVHARAPGYAIGDAEYRAGGAILDVRLEASVAVRGQVLDPSRRPLPGGFISQRQYTPDWPDPHRIEKDGTFLITGLGAHGMIQLLPRVPGYEATPFTIDLSMRVPDADGVIDLAPMILAPGARVSGRVRWATGAPAQEARMYLTRPEPPEPRDARWTETEHRSIYCDAEGAFRFLEMGAGTWRARILAPGVLDHMETFTLAPGERLEGLNWILPDTEGAVISGQVTGPEGAPLAHVYVNLRDESTELQASNYRRTDVDGNFRFDHLLGGSYQLYAHADDDAQKRLDLDAVLLAHVQKGVLPDGRHVHIQLRAADLEISGRVLDASGAAVAGAYVCREEREGRYSRGVLANAAGVFRIHVDSSAATRLGAWSTRPFGETGGNTHVAEIHLQRSIVDYPGKPLAAITRSSDGSTTDDAGTLGLIVLD